MDKATASSWQHQPMPELRVTLPYVRSFSADEYETISFGWIPREMEDKWFIFLEQDWLYIHRSWTGNCIYQLEINEIEGKWESTCVSINRDAEQYKSTDDSYDLAFLNFLISNLLLRENMPFPTPPEAQKYQAGVYQHHLVGRKYPEQEFPSKPWWKFW